jgi:signal transduction histidine kinase
MVEIAVRDAGLGIPPEQIPLLFHRFARLPRDLASPVAGSGLGLYLCRMLTESMGGTIRVESSGVAGEGSTFFVRLPLPPKAAAGSIASSDALGEQSTAPNSGAAQEERL